MSILRLLDSDKINVDTGPMPRGESDFSEITSDAFDAVNANYLAISRTRAIDKEFEANYQAYREATGEELKPSLAADYQPLAKVNFLDALNENDPLRGQVTKDSRLVQEYEHQKKWINRAVTELKGRDPVKFAKLQTEQEQITSAANKAQLTEQELADSTLRAPGMITAFGANLVGGGAAMFTDPLNLGATLATVGIGGVSLAAGRAAGFSTARIILTNALAEAGVNAGIEAIQQPAIASWQKEIGNNYGFSEAAANVGLAAVFGGAFSATLNGAQVLGSVIFNKLSRLKGLNPLEQTSAKMMEREASFKEADPFVAEKNMDATGKHSDSIDIMLDKINRGETLKATDLPIKNEEFLAALSDPNFGRNAIERAQLKELQDFKNKFASGALPVFHASPNDFSEFRFPSGENPYAKEGIGPHFGNQAQADFVAAAKGGKTKQYFLDIKNPVRLEDRNSWSHAAILKQLAEKKIISRDEVDNLLLRKNNVDARKILQEKGYDGIVYKNTAEGPGDSYIPLSQEQIKTELPQKVEAPVKLTKKQEKLQSILDEVFPDDTLKDIDTQRQILKQIDTPERMKIFEQDFARMLEENPKLSVTLEDGTTANLKDLVDDFKTDEKFVKEITNCATGGAKK